MAFLQQSCSRQKIIRFSIALAFLALMASCEKKEDAGLAGYVEGQFVYVASQLSGTLEALSIAKGQRVKKGDLLFSLDSQYEKESLLLAQARLEQAESKLADLQKGLRPAEMDQIKAQLTQARAAAQLSAKELARRQDLFNKQALSKEDLDKARTTNTINQARVKQLLAEQKQGQQGARENVVLAAQAEVAQARASLSQAEWSLDQKVQTAPFDALVFDTPFQKGDWVPPGGAAAVLLPPENTKIRFFVPETQLGALPLGKKVEVHSDGRARPIEARIDFVSPQAEYTPPVIYSQEFRAKMVFMVEASMDPQTAGLMHPGQPVSIYLNAGAL